MSQSWLELPLAELTSKVGSGATPKGGESVYQPTGVPLIRSMNVIFFGFKREGLAYLGPEHANELKNSTVKAGDVLLNITGASIGRVTIAPSDMDGARVNQHVCIIRPCEALDGRFLSAYLSSPAIQDKIWSDNYGVTRQALTKQQVLDLKIPVPSLAEQQRIADKLDVLLARLDAMRVRLNRIPTLLKRFRQSVLAAATNGQLTEEWRQEQSFKASFQAILPVHHRSEIEQPPLDGRVENAILKGESDTSSNASKRFAGEWERVALAQVGYDFSYGSAAKSSKTGSVPVLRMGNIQDGKLDWNDLVFSSDESEINKYRLVAGDVLFNRTNSPALVGKTAVFNGEREAIYAGYLIRVRCSPKLLPNYLNYCLSSPAGRDYCWQVKSDGVSQSNINAKKLAAFEFDLPSIPEQIEIVRRVEALFAFADAVESRYIAARAQIDRLSPALLAKAFRSELVSQDSSDESADRLLARIHATREPSGSATKRRLKKQQGVHIDGR